MVGGQWRSPFYRGLGARWDVSSSHIDLLSGINRPAKIDFENFLSDFFCRKLRFFSIFAKCALITMYTSCIVSRHSPGLQRPISGHILHFRPLPDNIGKIEKIDFFDIFAKFICAVLCILWPGPAGSGRGCQWSQKTHSPKSLDAFSYLYRYHGSSRPKVMSI